MIDRVYDEILRLILREVNRLNIQVADSFKPSLSLDDIPRDSGNANNSSTTMEDDGLGWTSSKGKGGIEHESNPFYMRPFENFNYALYYNESEQLTDFTSNFGNVQYHLIKDIYDDLILVKVEAPLKSFYVGLIFENYDVRVSLLPYVRKKGKLTEVIILDLNMKEIPLKIEVEPKYQEVFLGQTAEYVAYAIYANDRKEDITESCEWSIDSPCLINKGNVSNTIMSGLYKVTATYHHLTDQAELEVFDWNLVVRPDVQTVFVGEHAYYKAYQVYGNKEKDVTIQCDWSIDKYKIYSGLVTDTKFPGTATITASYKNKFDNASLIVTPENPKMVSIKIDPIYTRVTLGKQEQVQFNAYKVFSDGSVTPLYDGTWSIDKYNLTPHNNYAIVDQLTEVGRATITLKWKDFSTTAILEVVLESNDDDFTIEIVPNKSTIYVNDTQQYKIFKVDKLSRKYDITNDPELNVTLTKAYSTELPNCLINLNKLVYNTTLPEIVQIHASWQGKNATAILQIIERDSSSLLKNHLEIDPIEKWIKLGEEVKLTVYEVTPYGSKTDITSRIKFTVSPDLCEIDENFVFHGDALGDFVVTAYDETLNATVHAIIHVLPFDDDDPDNEVVYIKIVPEYVKIGINHKFQFLVYKVYPDGHQELIPGNECKWTITKYSINSYGVVYDTSEPGIAKITAYWRKYKVTAILEVVGSMPSDEEPELKDLIIYPKDYAMVKTNDKTTFVAFAKYSGNKFINVTDKVTWHVSSSSAYMDSNSELHTFEEETFTVYAEYESKTSSETTVYVVNNPKTLKIVKPEEDKYPIHKRIYPKFTVYTEEGSEFYSKNELIIGMYNPNTQTIEKPRSNMYILTGPGTEQNPYIFITGTIYDLATPEIANSGKVTYIWDIKKVTTEGEIDNPYGKLEIEVVALNETPISVKLEKSPITNKYYWNSNDLNYLLVLGYWKQIAYEGMVFGDRLQLKVYFNDGVNRHDITSECEYSWDDKYNESQVIRGTDLAKQFFDDLKSNSYLNSDVFCIDIPQRVINNLNKFDDLFDNVTPNPLRFGTLVVSYAERFKTNFAFPDKDFFYVVDPLEIRLVSDYEFMKDAGIAEFRAFLPFDPLDRTKKSEIDITDKCEWYFSVKNMTSWKSDLVPLGNFNTIPILLKDDTYVVAVYTDKEYTFINYYKLDVDFTPKTHNKIYDPNLAGLEIVPKSLILLAGESFAFNARAYYSVGPTKTTCAVVTDSCDWNFIKSNNKVYNTNNIVYTEPDAPRGDYVMIASYGDFNDYAKILVRNHVIRIVHSYINFKVGEHYMFNAELLPDKKLVSSECEWYLTKPDGTELKLTAPINIYIDQEGTYKLKAVYTIISELFDEIEFTASTPNVIDFTITPKKIKVFNTKDSNITFNASLIFNDGTSKEVTSLCTWEYSPINSYITNNQNQFYVYKGVPVGTYQVIGVYSGTYGDYQSTCEIIVEDGNVITKLTIAPESLKKYLPAPIYERYKAYIHKQDGTILDCSTSCSWSISPSGTILNGNVTINDETPQTYQITATYNELSAQASLEVAKKTLAINAPNKAFIDEYINFFVYYKETGEPVPARLYIKRPDGYTYDSVLPNYHYTGLHTGKFYVKVVVLKDGKETDEFVEAIVEIVAPELYALAFVPESTTISAGSFVELNLKGYYTNGRIVSNFSKLYPVDISYSPQHNTITFETYSDLTFITTQDTPSGTYIVTAKYKNLTAQAKISVTKVPPRLQIEWDHRYARTDMTLRCKVYIIDDGVKTEITQEPSLVASITSSNDGDKYFQIDYDNSTNQFVVSCYNDDFGSQNHITGWAKFEYNGLTKSSNVTFFNPLLTLVTLPDEPIQINFTDYGSSKNDDEFYILYVSPDYNIATSNTGPTYSYKLYSPSKAYGRLTIGSKLSQYDAFTVSCLVTAPSRKYKNPEILFDMQYTSSKILYILQGW